VVAVTVPESSVAAAHRQVVGVVGVEVRHEGCRVLVPMVEARAADRALLRVRTMNAIRARRATSTTAAFASRRARQRAK